MLIEYIPTGGYYLATYKHAGRTILCEGSTWQAAFRGCIEMLREAMQ